MKGDERGTALRANIAVYEDFDEQLYINGAPHLKHPSISGIYRMLVERAIDSLERRGGDISVLELGAGNGLASTPWLERGVKLTAVDSSSRMLEDFDRRARSFGAAPTTITADVVDYLTNTKDTFDVVTHVSMLHHIPDYIGLLRLSTAHVAPRGALVTFQDPLRYDRMPRHHHISDRMSYFIWRIGQGNYRRGLKTRWRRLRGVYSPAETVDFDEYHVVRNGVDSDVVRSLLQASFREVREVRYWSTYSRPLQRFGERLHLTSCFGVLATSKKGSGESSRYARHEARARSSRPRRPSPGQG